MRAEAKRRAFTLVEIMLVVSVIGLLAALALPSFLRARQDSYRVVCVNNLRQMAAAKEMAAFAMGWAATAGPATVGNPGYRNTIALYLKGGERPKCPTGAECFFNALDTAPTCQSSITSHVYRVEN